MSDECFEAVCDACENEGDCVSIAGQNLCFECAEQWNQCKICKEHFPYQNPDDDTCAECKLKNT